MVVEDPAVLWERYIQLTQIDAAFRTMKSETWHPPHLSPTRASGREAHPGGVSCLLSDRDAEKSTPSPGAGSDAQGGTGETGRHPDARCMAADHRWPLARDARSEEHTAELQSIRQ